jgi:predicted nucleotidyltransferase component of viral defense system
MVEKLRDFSGQRRQAIPHDLFDLYHLSRNIDKVERVIETFPQKCKVKGISLDSIDLKKVVARKSEYENNWRLGLEYLIPKNLKVSFEVAWDTSVRLLEKAFKKNNKACL